MPHAPKLQNTSTICQKNIADVQPMYTGWDQNESFPWIIPNQDLKKLVGLEYSFLQDLLCFWGWESSNPLTW